MYTRLLTLIVAAFSFVVVLVPGTAAAQYYPSYMYYPPTVQAPLACSVSVAEVRAGDSVSFVATGGYGGAFNWATPERTYLNIGPTLTVALYVPGVQTVTVSSGVQTASCTVRVLPSFGSGASVQQVPSYPVTYFAAQYIPSLPNTGFAPLTAASFGFAAVLLIAAGLFVSPYVKRTIVATFR